MIKLYGPEAADQINPDLISSWTFDDLDGLMSTDDDIEGDLAVLKKELENSQFIIFALVDWLPRKRADRAIYKFLDQIGIRSSKSKIIAVAYGAPYYLDSTYIRKLDAYFAVYSKIDSFIEISVRAIFRELSPKGSSPVDIDGYSVNKYVAELRGENETNLNHTLNKKTNEPSVTDEKSQPEIVSEGKPPDNTPTPIKLKEIEEKSKFWSKVMDNITQILLAIIGIIGTIAVTVIQKKKSKNGTEPSG